MDRRTPAKNQRILLIDDDQTIHPIFREMLRVAARDGANLGAASGAKANDEIDFEVDSAYQGEEGVELVRHAHSAVRPYALAFVDVRLPPGCDGIETTKRIWAVDPDVQIVICTAYADYSWDQVFENVGNTDRAVILKKPFEAVEVLQLAYALTEKWRLIQGAKNQLRDLDRMVRERTQELEATNERLQREMTERKRMEARVAAFSDLGHKLSSAKTAVEAAKIIVEAADSMLGWDACVLELYSAEQDRMFPVLNVDTIGGIRTELPNSHEHYEPTPMTRRVLAEGGKLLLRAPGEEPSPALVPFGDTARRSASILLVPIRDGDNIVGVSSVQSYRAQAYDDEALGTLQALADHCGGALHRIWAEEFRRQSELELRSLVESVQAVVWRGEAQTFKITYISKEAETLLGYPIERWVKESQFWQQHMHPEDRTWAPAFCMRETRAGRDHEFQYRMVAADGRVVWLRDIVRLVCDDGRPRQLVGVMIDITGQKAAEDQIRASLKEQEILLKEKEVLLKEIHHRVKNNMQIVSGLLQLQSGYVKDPQALEFFKESQSRIKSMALIHETLYQSKDLARIDFDAYLRKLTVNVFHSFGSNLTRVGLNVGAPDIFLDVNKAVPCGLIVNELVSNALKYAFPDNRAGEVDVSLKPAGGRELCLQVRDNGAGPPPDWDYRRTETFGWKLILILVEQIGGVMQVDCGDGTAVSITFNDGGWKKDDVW